MKLLKYPNGKYTIYNIPENRDFLEKWIVQSNFLQYEKEELILKKKSRKRNKLYDFHLTCISKNVVMKVSQIDKNYKFWRKVNLFITSLYKDYNFNSYKNTINLIENGVETIVPIAYWNYKTSLLSYKSYFLYEKVDSELTVTDLYNEIKSNNLKNEKEFINSITDKYISMIKSIHNANIRHDDPHGGNILTSIYSNNVKNIKTSDLRDLKFTLIDNDRCSQTLLRINILKQFFDLKCLKNFSIPDISDQVILQKYFAEKYNQNWNKVLKFWKTGGFSLKKRIYYYLGVKHLYQ